MVYAVGDMQYGQLGLGYESDSIMELCDNFDTFTTISCRDYHSVSIGNLWSFGKILMVNWELVLKSSQVFTSINFLSTFS